MPITYPLPLSQFWNTLPLAACDIALPAGVQQSRTRGGELRTANVANRLWAGTVVLRSIGHYESSRILSALDKLQEAGSSFMVHPWPICYPENDRGGLLLSGYSPKLLDVAANNYELRLSGMPPGYTLPAGSFLAFAYGTSPVRYAFHRTFSDTVANASGETALVPVSPHIRPGYIVGSNVTLIRPSFRANVDPDSVSVGNMVGNRRQGIGFSFMQTLGAN